jgi:hypothetical protein
MLPLAVTAKVAVPGWPWSNSALRIVVATQKVINRVVAFYEMKAHNG